MENSPVASVPVPAASSLRWEILRRAFLSRSSHPLTATFDGSSAMSIKRISRRTSSHFNMIPCHLISKDFPEDLDASLTTGDLDRGRDIHVFYKLPVVTAPSLVLIQRIENSVDLNDFEISNEFDVDNTGLVCHREAKGNICQNSSLHDSEINSIRCIYKLTLGLLLKTPSKENTNFGRTHKLAHYLKVELEPGMECWKLPLRAPYHPCDDQCSIEKLSCWPSEDVLTHICLKNSDIFSDKKVIELGSGYGLAGLAIAAGTNAREVVVTDGNPQVIDYVQHNIKINAGSFGDKKVKTMTLHWNQHLDSDMLNAFDIIIASDCTFFKEFHESLTLTVRSLLKHSESSKAIFLSPRRGDSLDKFLEAVQKLGLQFELAENYDNVVWERHLKFLNGDEKLWPNYDKDHCYPLLVTLTF